MTNGSKDDKGWQTVQKDDVYPKGWRLACLKDKKLKKILGLYVLEHF